MAHFSKLSKIQVCPKQGNSDWNSRRNCNQTTEITPFSTSSLWWSRVIAVVYGHCGGPWSLWWSMVIGVGYGHDGGLWSLWYMVIVVVYGHCGGLGSLRWSMVIGVAFGHCDGLWSLWRSMVIEGGRWSATCTCRWSMTIVMVIEVLNSHCGLVRGKLYLCVFYNIWHVCHRPRQWRHWTLSHFWGVEVA